MWFSLEIQKYKPAYIIGLKSVKKKKTGKKVGDSDMLHCRGSVHTRRPRTELTAINTLLKNHLQIIKSESDKGEKERRSQPALRDAYEGGTHKVSGFYFCYVFACLVFVRGDNNKKQWLSIVESYYYALIYPDSPASLFPRLSDSSLWSCSWLCVCVFVCVGWCVYKNAL